VRHRKIESAEGQRTLWSGDADPDMIALCKARQAARQPDRIPEDRVEWVRENLCLSDFYADWVEPDELARVARGTMAVGTVDKTRQAIRRWEKFTRPERWRGLWRGPSIGFIDSEWLQEFADNVVAKKTLQPATLKSTIAHLQMVFRAAVKKGALDEAPTCDAIPMTGSGAYYTENQVETVYESLSAYPSLQVAFVIGCNAGMRPCDLFGLRWQQIDWQDRSVSFVSQKTGKAQIVPLAEVSLNHLRRLGTEGEYIFPEWISPGVKDPRRTYRVRKRNAILHDVNESVGIEHRCPWQACRATCNQRLQMHRYGAGDFVLGHAQTLNSVSYFAPSDLIREAIRTVPQPKAFLEAVGMWLAAAG
jgi:integrase